MSNELYEEKFKSLIKHIKEIVVLEMRLALRALLEELKDGERRINGSYIFAEKAVDHYELLRISIGDDAADFIPPHIDHVAECMKELLAKKKKITSLNLESLYREKFPGDSAGKWCFPAGFDKP